MFLNFVIFQICWLACVLGGAYDLPWAGVVFVTGAVAWHLYTAGRVVPEIALLAGAGLLGAVWDSVLVALGWMAYPSGTLVAGTAPYWIVALWVGFATTLNVSLRWLKRHLAMASALGAVAGPLAYLAGAKLGGVTFTDISAALTALTLGWATITPLLLAVARRLNGFDGADPISAAPLTAGN